MQADDHTPSLELYADAGRGVRICYETFGDIGDPALVLIMGLGFPMVMWPDRLCSAFAERGFFVVRFDNRDVGRSSRVPESYTLADMADDTVGLLDALKIGAVHVVGASMGGRVAQVLAVRHPHRVLSLASLMASTGSRRVGRPSLKVLRFLVGRRPTGREAITQRRLRVFAAIGSTGFEQDLDELRRVTLLAVDRDGGDRSGRRRQHAAVRRAGDRTASLTGITVPTVVIHGRGDRMVHVSGGMATAAAIRGSQLVLVDGLGHDLPPGAWPVILEAVVTNAERA